jgi:hypothetical protein
MISAIASLVQIIAAPCISLHPAKDEGTATAVSAREDALHEEESLLPDAVAGATPGDAPTSIFAPAARKGTLISLAAMLLQQLSGESLSKQTVGLDSMQS